MYDRVVGDFWLRQGWKYRCSAWWYRKAWDLPMSVVLAKHGISLNGAATIPEVVERFKGRVRWRPDALFQIADLIKPPLVLLDDKGEDCDGIAGLWAAAIKFALSQDGYQARIVSYLAAPWQFSHHICLVGCPDGGLVAIQPPPSEAQDPDLDPVVRNSDGSLMRFASYEQAAHEIASWYGATVQGFDVRDSHWGVVEKWRWLA